jgi:hypothetical protein
LEIATYRGYLCFDGERPIPSDFFNDLGADGVGDEFFHFFRSRSDVTLNVSDSINTTITMDEIGGFAF